MKFKWEGVKCRQVLWSGLTVLVTGCLSLLEDIYRCPGRNVPDFGRMFLTLKYTDLTKNTYIQSWTVHIYIYIYIYINSSTIIKNKNYKLQKAKIYIINNSKSNNVEGFYPTPRTRNIIKPCHFIVIRLHLHKVWQCPLGPKYIVCCQPSTVLQ